MNVYTGSNDVLYWLYNSHQICKGKTGLYLVKLVVDVYVISA